MNLLHSPRKKVFCLAFALWLGAAISQVCASILLVTSTADNGDGSLRDTIAMANDGDTIQFDTVLKGRTIVITGFFIEINSNITINGLGSHLLSVARTDGYGPILYVLPNRTVVIQGLTISANGGGLVTEAALTVNQCVITGCSSNLGGGIECIGNAAQLTLIDSTVSFNTVTGGGRGAGIYNESGTATIINSVLNNNNAFNSLAGYGGGIYNGGVMEVTNSLITSNGAANDGGGILNDGTLTITDSTVSNNHAGTDVIGTGAGGGIYNGGTVQIQNSTISDNEVIGSSQSGSGGGVFTSGPLTMTDITNSTISNNSANQYGGGIDNSGMLIIANSSFSGNRASKAGGGIRIHKGATVEIRNTLLNAGTPGANISNSGGTLASHGYNLSSDDAGGLLTASGDQINTNPMLGPLQDNGGPTFTHKLLMGSPAIDAGDPNFKSPPLYDQRGFGFPRVFGDRLDIGSLELQLSTKLLNISTRLRVLTGDNVLIGGFIVTANSSAPSAGPNGVSKRVIVRAIGPSLANAGVPGALPDPILELHGPKGFVTLTNDNWRDNQEAEIEATGVAPTDNLESAIVATLPPGAYTAVVSGTNNGIGVGLIEAYDLDASADVQLANISTRGFVESGDNVMIGGFILGSGSANASALIRAIGPSLTASGVPDALTDPTLELHNSNGASIAANDNWRDTQQAEIEATGIPPSDDRESAIVATLLPGAYTAIVRGKDSATGVALVEAYQLASASTPAPTPSPTATPTSTPTATATSTPVATATSTATATPTPTSTSSPTPSVTPSPTPAHFSSLTSHASVDIGDAIMLNAFIITGPDFRRVIVRGLGPSLSPPMALADPLIELRRADGTVVATNDDWRSTQEAEIIASGFAPTNDLESAIVATLDPDSYTVVLRGVGNTTGHGIGDLHDLSPSSESRLTAIGTRANVLMGDDALMSGIVVQQTVYLLVRGLGPSLSEAGVANILADPTLELRNGNGVLLLANDNWRDLQEAEITATGIPPTNDLEAAIVTTLTPGSYTAIARGRNNTTGIGCVQFYGLPHSGPVLELTP